MRIFYNDYIKDLGATAVSSLTADLVYPVENVQDQRLAVEYRSTAVTSQTITFDLGSARGITAIAVLSHNITTAATIIMDANTSDSWPGATSETLTHNVGPIVKYISTKTYRYWQLQINDTGNTDGYLSIGRVMLGTYLQINPSSLLDFKVTKKRSDTVTYGKNRQKHASEGEGWRRFELSFPPSENAMITSIEDLFDQVGNHTSVLFSNFDDLRTYQLVEPCYCSIVGDVGFRHSGRLRFSYDLTLEEDK